jgi:hypothetical protein
MAHRKSYHIVGFNILIHAYIVFDNFEHLLNGEVLNGLEAAVLATPGQRRALLTKWLELQERVINAVKQHLVVDVLALREEIASFSAPIILHFWAARGIISGDAALVFATSFEL